LPQISQQSFPSERLREKRAPGRVMGAKRGEDLHKGGVHGREVFKREELLPPSNAA